MGFCIQKWGHLPLKSVSVRAASRQVVCTKNRQENRRSTISEIAGRLGLAYGIYQRIRREGLKMWRISPKFVKKHKQCLAARNTSMAPDHPYTPNLAPYDFYLCMRMKSQLYGRRLQDMDKTRSNR